MKQEASQRLSTKDALSPEIGSEEHQYERAAETFIKWCRQDNVEEQLESREIFQYNIRFVGMSNTGLGMVGDKFVIFIDKFASPEKQAIQLGCVVAKTFHYNLTKQPPADYLSLGSRKKIEVFYETFATRWIAEIGMDAITKYLATAGAPAKTAVAEAKK